MEYKNKNSNENPSEVHTYGVRTANELTTRHDNLVTQWEEIGLSRREKQELIHLDIFIDEFLPFNERGLLKPKTGKLQDELKDLQGKNLGGDPDKNGIWTSARDFAADIYSAFQNSDTVVGKAPTQYGKTDTMFHLANFHIRNNGKVGEKVLFVTAMRDTDLYEQNKRNLMDRTYFTKSGEEVQSNIYVVKMSDFIKKSDEIFERYNINHVFFDESDYGSGKDSNFDIAFFKNLTTDILSGYKTLLMSATSFDACHAIVNGKLIAEVVEAKPSDKYFGVNDMLEAGMIENNHTIEQVYDEKTGKPKKDRRGALVKVRVPYQFYNYSEEDGSISLTGNFKSKMDEFSNREGGALGIIRINDIDRRLNERVGGVLPSLLENKYKDVEVIMLGVHYEPIKEILDGFFLNTRVVQEGKKVLLVVINALTAGKDLDILKEHTHLIIETRMDAIANGVQGLAGRITGYHGNRDITIVASKPIIQLYAQFEKNYEVIKNPVYINDIKEIGVRLSTNLANGGKTSNNEHFVSTVRGKFSVEDVLNEDPELKALFDDEVFGTFEELKAIIGGGQSKGNSAINSQRLSKYKANPAIFHNIWEECLDKTIVFDNRFHRFRAYGNVSDEDYDNLPSKDKAKVDTSRAKQAVIKRGVIYNDMIEGKKEFFIIDRSDETYTIVNNKTLKNSSQYWCED